MVTADDVRALSEQVEGFLQVAGAGPDLTMLGRAFIEAAARGGAVTSSRAGCWCGQRRCLPACLATRIRRLPLAADTVGGARQRWVRECAACLVEGQPLPPDPAPTASSVRRTLHERDRLYRALRKHRTFGEIEALLAQPYPGDEDNPPRGE